MLVFAACGGQGGTPEPAETDTTVEGRVRIAGSTPLERVLIEPDGPGAAAFEVAGDLRPELKRLSGAHVRVRGEFVSDDRLRVSEYAILDISGHEPAVGVLEVDGGVATLVDAEGGRTRLRDAPPELLEQRGAKVWVALNNDGVVIGYGIIREH